MDAYDWFSVASITLALGYTMSQARPDKNGLFRLMYGGGPEPSLFAALNDDRHLPMSFDEEREQDEAHREDLGGCEDNDEEFGPQTEDPESDDEFFTPDDCGE